MHVLSPAQQMPFGLLELDACGTVLYSNIEEPARAARRNFAGQNFDEVMRFSNVAELRRHLDRFRQADHGVEDFNFTCHFIDGSTAPVKVLLARIREMSDGARTKSILVHIRKAK